MLCRSELCYVEENVMLFACVRVFNLINRLMNCICWVYVESKLDVVKRLWGGKGGLAPTMICNK